MSAVWTAISDFFVYIFGGTPSGGSTAVTGFATEIVNWLIATPIALIPLALYCLVAIVGVIRRMLPGV